MTVSVVELNGERSTESGEITTVLVATTIDAVAVFPSLVAVIVAVPVATPVAMPDALTVATFASLLDQVTARPVSTFPLASLSVAV